MGKPRASEFDALAWARYRQSRLTTVFAQTINHEQRYLSAVFSALIRWVHGMALIRWPMSAKSKPPRPSCHF
jgi:hypothetical protein